MLMKTLYLTFFVIVAMFFYSGTTAQVLEVEKTYEISGKAKRGALAQVEYDKEAQVYSLIYVTKSTARKAKFQTYMFDKDFNFIKLVEDEIEFEKAKQKYSWFNFNGELYTVVGNAVTPNLVGTLILKKKEITYKYDWLLLGYYKTVKILNKVKPKTDDGRKFFYHKHAEDEKTGDIYVLCGIKDHMKKGADPYMHMKKFVVLKFNKDLEIVAESSIEFDYPQTIVEAKKLQSYTNPNIDIESFTVVFAPMGGIGMKKVQDPSKTSFRYVRVNSDCKVVDNIKFESNTSYWKIDETIHEVMNDDIYLFGPSAAGKDKYYNASTASKFKSVQLMKVADNKQEYLTETMLEEFEQKMKSPPSQKKTPAYKGKKFQIANYKIASNGDFFVIGQNFKPSSEGNQFTDILSFHFDNKGLLKSQYGIKLEQSNKYAKAAGCPQQFIESADNKSMYWVIYELKGPAAWTQKPLSYPRVGKIDLGTGNINDFVSYGYGKKKDYYLDPNFPMLETEKGSRIVFFGSDKSGRNIWFARIYLK